jgi:hypothetical protein
MLWVMHVCLCQVGGVGLTLTAADRVVISKFSVVVTALRYNFVCSK